MGVYRREDPPESAPGFLPYSPRLSEAEHARVAAIAAALPSSAIVTVPWGVVLFDQREGVVDIRIDVRFSEILPLSRNMLAERENATIWTTVADAIVARLERVMQAWPAEPER